jgi:hypothetical protein
MSYRGITVRINATFASLHVCEVAVHVPVHHRIEVAVHVPVRHRIG